MAESGTLVERSASWYERKEDTVYRDPSLVHCSVIVGLGNGWLRDAYRCMLNEVRVSSQVVL